MYGSHSRFTSQRHIERLPYPSNCHYPRQGNECKQLAHSCYSEISAKTCVGLGKFLTLFRSHDSTVIRRYMKC